jgi:hypothetical protein
MIAGCGGCPRRWRSAALCHCSACHRIFGGVVGFDRHRRGGECDDPAADPYFEVRERPHDGPVWVDAGVGARFSGTFGGGSVSSGGSEPEAAQIPAQQELVRS